MKQIAAKNLMDFSAILDDLNIVYWLDGGTALGAYRDHDFCDGDENDIDLFTWANYQFLIPTILERAYAIGFTLHNHWDGDPRAPKKAQQIAVVKDKHKIDLNFFESKEHTAWGCVYSGTTCIPQIAAIRFYQELSEIEFYGKKFNIPRNIEGYLTYRYGDWKTPIHRSHYSCYSTDQLRALNPDFKFYEDNS